MARDVNLHVNNKSIPGKLSVRGNYLLFEPLNKSDSRHRTYFPNGKMEYKGTSGSTNLTYGSVSTFLDMDRAFCFSEDYFASYS